MDVEVVPVSEFDARHVARHLRDADVRELTLSNPGVTPEQSVMDSVYSSAWCDAVKVYGVPVVLYGLCESGKPHVGIPWMVATDGIKLISKQFLLGCASRVQRMHGFYPVLCNQVHRKNEISIRWLRWLGFVIDETPVGNNGEFYTFFRVDLNGVFHG